MPSPAPTPPRRDLQHARTAYDQLRDLIVRGRLAPGSRLIEQELAGWLGVSRTPVREAMTRLVQEGFARPLRESTRTQLVVAPLTHADLDELYTIMGALEGAAARRLQTLAVSARAALANDLEAAQRRFERVAKAARPEFDRLFETHNAFHTTLLDRCASARLRVLIEQVRPHVQRYEYIYAAAIGSDYSDTYAEHRAIISAVRAGSVAGAERAVRANWFNSARRLSAATRALPSLGDVTGVVPGLVAGAHATAGSRRVGGGRERAK